MSPETPPPPEPPVDGDGLGDVDGVDSTADVEPTTGGTGSRHRTIALAAGALAAVVALVVALVLITGGSDDETADGDRTGTTTEAEASGPGGTGDPAGEAGDDPDGDGPGSGEGEGDGEGQNGEPGSGNNPGSGNQPGGGDNPSGGSGGGNDPDVTVPPEQLNEAYARGYTDVCNEVWSVSDNNGMVYDPEDPEFGYGIDECLDYLDDSWGEIEDSLEDAYDAGRAEAELMVESLTFSGLLCNQSLERCWEVP